MGAVQVGFVHIYGGNLLIVVGRVIVNAFVGVATGRVDGVFVAVFYATSAFLLRHAAQNMEKLRHARRFVAVAHRVVEHKCRSHKARRRRQIARQPKSARAAAVRRYVDIRGKAVVCNLARCAHIVRQVKQMEVKRGAVGHYVYGVVVNGKSVDGAFHNDRLRFVCNMPMQRRRGQLIAEIYCRNVYIAQQFARLLYGGALRKYPRDKFKRSDVYFVRRGRRVVCKLRKVKSRNAKPLFVGSVVVQRIVLLNKRHTYHCVVRLYCVRHAQGKRIVARRYGNRFVVTEFVIEIAPEIMVGAVK